MQRNKHIDILCRCNMPSNLSRWTFNSATANKRLYLLFSLFLYSMLIGIIVLIAFDSKAFQSEAFHTFTIWFVVPPTDGARAARRRQLQ